MKTILLSLLSLVVILHSPQSKANAPAKQRILVVAPHPDDEVLGAGGVIRKALLDRKNGADVDVHVVVMTAGDGYPEAVEKLKQDGKAIDQNGDGVFNFIDLGILRHTESLTALKYVGLPEEKVTYFGFPDAGLKTIFSTTEVYSNAFTGTTSVPYSFAVHPNQNYSREALLKNLNEVLTVFQPTEVYTPTPTDHHHDHATTREFVKVALQEIKSTAAHYEYLIHWEKFDAPWPYSTTVWTIPVGHIAADITKSLEDAAWNRQEKTEAIRKYSSQVALDGEYLLKFAKDAEQFWISRATVEEYLIK